MVLIWERWQAGKCPNKKWRFEWENPWARWEIFKQPPCLITRGFAANGRWMLPKKYNESGLLFKQWISRSEDHEIARDFSSYWFYHEHMWILPLKLYVYIYIYIGYNDGTYHYCNYNNILWFWGVWKGCCKD